MGKIKPIETYSMCSDGMCIAAEEVPLLKKEQQRIPHIIKMFDGSEVKRNLALVFVGPGRVLMLACEVTGALFHPDTGQCLSTWQVRADPAPAATPAAAPKKRGQKQQEDSA